MVPARLVISAANGANSDGANAHPFINARNRLSIGPLTLPIALTTAFAHSKYSRRREGDQVAFVSSIVACRSAANSGLHLTKSHSRIEADPPWLHRRPTALLEDLICHR